MRRIDNFWKKVFRVCLRKYGDFIYHFTIIDGNLLIFQSDGDFCDNAYALFDYMIKNNFNKKYHIVWLVQSPNEYESLGYENVSFIRSGSFNFFEILYESKMLHTSRYLFFTHHGYGNARKGQTVINLWHGGVVLKSSGGTEQCYKTFDYQSSPSPAAAERMHLFTGVRKEQVIINGDCRQDYLFSDCEEKVKVFLGKGYDKYILGMPTFKKTKKWTDAKTDSWILPVIKSKEQFEKLDDFCKKENVLIILKIHHLEDISFIDAQSMTNIRILKDEDLNNADIQLYELIGKTDALLTDFSSVAYDYMLLNRPIGYMISEIQNYTRGFIIDNIEKEMAGEKLLSVEDLQNFIMNVKSGVDNYAMERKVLADKFFVYQRDGNCERLLKHLGIDKDITQ